MTIHTAFMFIGGVVVGYLLGYLVGAALSRLIVWVAEKVL